MKIPHPLALFRMSVLGSLISSSFHRGELKQEIARLANRSYAIPGSDRLQISPKTIERWYYTYQREGLDGLAPTPRIDQGISKLPTSLQEAIVAAKQANPKRSIRQLVILLENEGVVAKGTLSRSAVHRLLQQHGISRPSGGASEKPEHRSFTTQFAGDIWYGDVMHGPKVLVEQRWRKVYLVSLMDDASRLITHSSFCLGETALDIEGVLKNAVLKRGRPQRLVVDNGAAYRANSLQGICARLGIALIYCRPYAPEGKGKLERWHRTVREQFLTEIDFTTLTLEGLNRQWWAWVEQHYHCSAHSSMGGQSPLLRYQQDLERIRPLGALATRLDEIFYHREQRKVRKDGSVSYQGTRFEVDYHLSGETVTLVVNPHSGVVVSVVDNNDEPICLATPQDTLANSYRRRAQPYRPETTPVSTDGPNPVTQACDRHYGSIS